MTKSNVNINNKITDENYLIEDENGNLIPNYDLTLIDFKDGDILRGRVVKIDKDEVLVDIGFKSEGVIPQNELSIRNSIKPGEVLEIDEEIEIMVLQKEDQDGRLLLSKRRAEIEKSFDLVEEKYNNGDTVEGEVIECVKGGLILDIGLRGFLPASLIDIRKTRDLESYIGEKCQCKIIEVDRPRNNVVLSRKAIIEDARKEQRKEALSSIEVGQVKEGIITSIADFGAFVDVNGIDGLVHISELSWDHVKHPSEVVKINDKVSVEVLDIDYGKQRLSLGLKQTQKDPWVEKIKNYSIKDVVEGKVTRIVKFGLFVQIEDGMEGLVHITELSPEPIKKPSDVAKIGDILNIRIIDIDFDKRRMAFSVKQVDFPEADEKKEDTEAKTQEEPEKVDSKEQEEKAEVEDKKEEDSKGEVKEEKPEAKEESAEAEIKEESKENSKEVEKKETIQKLLKEMKDEANLD